jgi:hypothetical protein
MRTKNQGGIGEKRGGVLIDYYPWGGSKPQSSPLSEEYDFLIFALKKEVYNPWLG